MGPQSVDIIFSWIWFWIFLIAYIPIMVAVFYTAENRGESGFFWCILCIILPVVGVFIYIGWVAMLRIGNVKSKTMKLRGLETPDMSLSRQRLHGGGEFAGASYDEIEMHISLDEWDDAEKLVNTILEEAERVQDGRTIADMIAYRERIKKGGR